MTGTDGAYWNASLLNKKEFKNHGKTKPINDGNGKELFITDLKCCKRFFFDKDRGIE